LLTRASARISSFDLRTRAAMLRRRIEHHRAELLSGLERVMARKRRSYGVAQVRFASLDLKARVAQRRHAVERATALLTAEFRSLLARKLERARAEDVRLNERSPLRILERGYSITYDSSGNVLRSADQVQISDEISVRLGRGELWATVRKKKETQ